MHLYFLVVMKPERRNWKSAIKSFKGFRGDTKTTTTTKEDVKSCFASTVVGIRAFRTS